MHPAHVGAWEVAPPPASPGSTTSDWDEFRVKCRILRKFIYCNFLQNRYFPWALLTRVHGMGLLPLQVPALLPAACLQRLTISQKTIWICFFLCISLGNELKLKKIAGFHFWVKAIPLLNPFVPNAPFLYPLKTSENLCFQGV